MKKLYSCPNIDCVPKQKYEKRELKKIIVNRQKTEYRCPVCKKLIKSYQTKKMLCDMTEAEVRNKRLMTKRLYGKETDDLMKKMYKHFPELEAKIIECKKVQAERMKVFKQRHNEKKLAQKQKTEKLAGTQMGDKNDTNNEKSN